MTLSLKFELVPAANKDALEEFSIFSKGCHLGWRPIGYRLERELPKRPLLPSMVQATVSLKVISRKRKCTKSYDCFINN